MHGVHTNPEFINYAIFTARQDSIKERFSKKNQIELMPDSLLGHSLLSQNLTCTDSISKQNLLLAEITISRFLSLSPDCFYNVDEFQQDCDTLIDYVEKISIEKSLDLLENTEIWKLLANPNPTHTDLFNVVTQIFRLVSPLDSKPCLDYMNLTLGFDGIINPTPKSVCGFAPFQVLSFDKSYLYILKALKPNDTNALKRLHELI